MIALEWLAGMLRARSGLSIGADKLYLLETRLQPLLKREGLAGLDALAECLRRTGTGTALATEIVEAMTTNETLFFRDIKPFAHLASVGLPGVAAARPRRTPLRIWSAGASCGQEAYSIAMLVAENQASLAGRPVRIIGSDIASAPLARARVGLYSQFEVQRGLPARRLITHFERVAAGWQVRENLRAMCEFTRANLLDDPAPLGQFDIVFCRNVLIYFDDDTKARVLELLSRQLAPDGWLYLGSSETASGLCQLFDPSETEHAIYRPARAA